MVTGIVSPKSTTRKEVALSHEQKQSYLVTSQMDPLTCPSWRREESHEKTKIIKQVIRRQLQLKKKVTLNVNGRLEENINDYFSLKLILK